MFVCGMEGDEGDLGGVFPHKETTKNDEVLWKMQLQPLSG